MRSFIFLSFLLILSSCGDVARSRHLDSTPTSGTGTNQVTAKDSETTRETEKCSIEAAIKKTYQKVFELVKYNNSEKIGKIFTNNSLKTFSYSSTKSASGTETPHMMKTAFYVELGTQIRIVFAETNLDTCTVIGIHNTLGLEVSEEGEEL